ncbi:MAG: baseplate J/gp47 family protein, partial [Myxococcales bacterium]|nr:baseplate J/gp47 family protein [Myxococcales bacterium]
TGNRGSADPRHRQRLRLLPGSAGATAGVDPLSGDSYVRVRWRRDDALTRAYCFRARGDDGTTRDDLSGFWGNLVEIRQGEVVHASYHPPGTTLPGVRTYSRGADGSARLELADDEPLLYQQLDLPAGLIESDVAPMSTLSAMVSSGGVDEPWHEVISLVHSKGQDPDYAVETDERGRSDVIFGDGTNGRALADDAIVHLRLQTGYGPDGNLGADRLTSFDAAANPSLTALRNPFDITDGEAPKDPAEALREIPEAFRARQLRAVTLCDYAKAAMEVDGVAKAAARYTWAGSFRCVHLAVDPVGTDALTPTLRAAVEEALAPRRLLGEELRILGPRWVPLAIAVRVCARPEVWAADLRAVIEEELSAGVTSDGRLGFFHPDSWTFGQALRASELFGRIHAIPGVDQVVALTIRRHDAPTPGAVEEDGEVTLAADEIILVEGDPDQRERGYIDIDVQGGRG